MLMSIGFLISRQLIDILGQPPSPYVEYGCCRSCGFIWCPDLQECVRLWETYCKSLDTGH